MSSKVKSYTQFWKDTKGVRRSATKKKLGAFGGGQGFHELQTFNEYTKENEYIIIKVKHREDHIVYLHQRKIRGQV